MPEPKAKEDKIEEKPKAEAGPPPKPQAETPKAEEKPTPPPEPIKVERGNVSPTQLEEIERGEYVTIQEVAAKLRYTGAWITELVQKGRIKAIKPLGTRWRIPRSEFERLLKTGLPPPPRERAKPPVTQIHVKDEDVDKVLPPPPKEPPKKGPESWFPFDFSGLFGSESKK